MTSNPNSSPISAHCAGNAVDGARHQRAPLLALRWQDTVEHGVDHRAEHRALGVAETPRPGSVEPTGKRKQQAAGEAGPEKLPTPELHRMMIRVKSLNSRP